VVPTIEIGGMSSAGISVVGLESPLIETVLVLELAGIDVEEKSLGIVVVVSGTKERVVRGSVVVVGSVEVVVPWVVVVDPCVVRDPGVVVVLSLTVDDTGTSVVEVSTVVVVAQR